MKSLREVTGKVLAVTLSASMLFSMAACGGKKTEAKGGEAKTTAKKTDSNVNLTGYPICKKPIKITVAGCNSNSGDWNDTDMVKQINKQFGINMDCTSYESDAWETQLTLLMSSNKLPDLIADVAQNITQVNGYGEDGYFLPINKYLKYAPHLKAYMKKYPEYKANVTDEDGNIYGLTQSNENPIGAVNRAYMDKRWLAKVGMDAPKSVDDLYKVLKAFKEQDANGNGDPNDEIPMSSSPEGENILPIIMQAFGIFSYVSDYSPIVNKKEKVQIGQMTDNYKAFLKYMNKLYKDGLFDKDALVQTQDEQWAKNKEGRVGFYSAPAPYVASGQEISFDRNYIWLDGLTSDYNKQPSVVYKSMVDPTVHVAINADTKHPEAIMRLIDYFFTDTGSITASRGFEGVSYDVKKVDYAKGEEDAVVRCPKGFSSAEEYRYRKATINEAFRMRVGSQKTQYQILMDASNDELKDEKYVENCGWAALVEQGRRQLKAVDGFPTVVHTADEASRYNTLNTDISLYLEQSMAQFITGEINIDDGWNKYIKTLKQMGSDELTDLEQKAYNRLKKSIK